MSKVVIVYHSGSGHTARLAQAVARGAQSVSGTQALLVSVADVEKHWADLDAADAIVFGAPTYMGSASAQFKAFADATAKRWFTLAWKDKLAAGFSNSGSPAGDKLSTLQELAVLAAQHGMLWVGLGLHPMVPSQKHPGQLVNRAGAFLGATAQSPHGAPDAEAPPPVDLETGELLGARVAQAAARWVRGK
ncbi:MAG: flavodoxin family protein [Planctomycetes bacterium]|nr:flavodoxin family protein [Planctomycetota bacterium]